MHGRILIVDDDQSMCEMLEAGLKRHGFTPVWNMSAEEGLARLRQEAVDVVLTDLNMQAMNGLELCSRIGAVNPDLPVVILTAFGSLDTAIAALRSGAYDFVTKPIDIDFLAISLDRAVQHHDIKRQLNRLSEIVEKKQRSTKLIGESKAMHDLFTQLERVADSSSSVLLRGESGTGKELVAQAIHQQGDSAGHPFVAINCSALPEMLLESELFGHKRGAFTDAKTDRTGLFLEAKYGTLFLDEIGDMPLALQPKLLRALEDRKVRPVGGNTEIPFETRIIAATNKDLESAISEGLFREDLFYRLNVIELELPPLRERGTDVLLLANHFLKHFAVKDGKEVSGITESVAEKFLEYDWPGNVRELKNIVERAVALTRHQKIVMDDLPMKLRSYQGTSLQFGAHPAELVSLDAMEQRYINHVLKTVGDNRTIAAKILGLDRKTLYRKLQRYEGAVGD
jgi:DNA-binding NtrC family response regulator